MKKDLFSLEGKNALVVGGHGGIGRAIAEAFVMYGADVSIASRNMEKLQEAKEYIKENYGKEAIQNPGGGAYDNHDRQTARQQWS